MRPHAIQRLPVAPRLATRRPDPQEYLQLQEELGAALRAGFLSLAQARYAMGADRVSTLQLPAHMAATARLLGSAGAPPPAASAQPPAFSVLFSSPRPVPPHPRQPTASWSWSGGWPSRG